MGEIKDSTYGACTCSGTGGAATLNGASRGLAGVLEYALNADDFASRPGFLQQLDPRAKIIGAALMIIACVATHALWALAFLFALAILLAVSSNVPLLRLGQQIWLSVLLFTGAIALPSLFIVPGQAVATLPLLEWNISLQGLRSALFLVGRAEVSATLAFLLVLTTPWPQLLKALRAIGVPKLFVAILGMTHRFIFVLLTTASQMMEARRSRVLKPLSGAEKRRLIISSAGVLFDKTLSLASEVHQAMVSRGYTGEVRTLGEASMEKRDVGAALSALAISIGVVWLGR